MATWVTIVFPKIPSNSFLVKNMKYCCGGFEYAHKQNSNKRGVSIFTRVDDFDQPTFILLFRSINIDDEKEFSESTQFHKTYYIATERVIQYCPWCGKKLSSFYKKTWINLIKKSLMDMAFENENPLYHSDDSS